MFDITKDLIRGDKIRRIKPYPSMKLIDGVDIYHVGQIYTFKEYRGRTNDLYTEELPTRSGLCVAFEFVNSMESVLKNYNLLDDNLFVIE